MQALSGLLFAFTLVTGLVLGTRLLWLWRRTRGTPELVIGVAALATCLSGLVRVVMLRLPEDASPVLAVALHGTFSLLWAVGPSGMALGTWRVFRPDSRWAAALAIGLSAGMLLTVPSRFSVEPDAVGSLRSLFMLTAGLAVSVWTAAEALLHAGKLRRRMRLGLADAVTTAQFLSWGAAMVSNSLVRSLTLGLIVVRGIEPVGSSAFMLPAALLGFVTLACLYCAFFPPLALQDRLAARAAEG